MNTKKEQISSLIASIVLKKHSNLKDYKNDISKYVSKRVNESTVDADLKRNIEAEVLELFEREAFSKSFTKSTPRQPRRREDKHPVLPEGEHLDLDAVDVKPIPTDEEPIDM